jgi:alpha-galactosidase
MAELAEAIRLAGCRPWIWFRSLLTSESLPSSWILPNDRFPLLREPGLILDPSLPEVLERIAADVRVLTGWGYELVKHDYTTFDLFGRWGFEMGLGLTPESWSFYDRSRTTAEIVLDLYAKIYEAAGDALLIGCNTIGHLSAVLVHLQRVGDDTSGRVWARTRKMGINSLAFRILQHETFFAVDADCVGLTEDTIRSIQEPPALQRSSQVASRFDHRSKRSFRSLAG